MKSPNFPLYLSLIICSLTPALARAEGLTLDGAINEALSNSPVIQRAKSKAEEGSWGRVESLSGFLPSVTLDANHLLQKKYMLLDVTLPGSASSISIPQVIPGSILTLNAQLPVFDGLRNVNRYRAAKSMETAAHDEAEWTKFQTELAVKVLFYKALGSLALRDVAQQNVTALEDHLKDVNALQKAGVSTKYEVLRVDVQASEARSELLNAKDNVEIARAQLIEALGKSSDDRELIGTLPEPQESKIVNLDAKDLSGRKDIKALEAVSNGSRFQDIAASRFWMPRLGLFAQYQYYNNRSDGLSKWDDYRNAYLVGMNLSWNLFDGMSSIARNQQAIEKRIQTESTLRLAQLHSSQEFDLWRRKYLYQCAVYRSRLGDVTKAEESMRLAKSGRSAGTRTNTDLLDAEAEVFRAKAGLVNSQIGALEALTNLQLALGRNIP